jgi:MoxR-like ATPase
MAALRGRDFVLPDDIKRVADPVLRHRLILKPESRLRRVTALEIIDEIINSIAVPTVAGEVESR